MKLSIAHAFRGCSSWPQWLAAVEIGCLSLVIGIMNGWTSPYMARLTGPESELPLSRDEASWVASLINMGRMSGALLSGLGQLGLGMSSKTVLLWGGGVPTALGWLCLLAADAVGWLCVARYACGVGMGVFFASYPLFVGEIAGPKIRGSLIGFIMMCMPVGNLLGNVMGVHLSLRSFAIASLVPNLAYLLAFALLPPSPHHLARRPSQLARAERALAWYDNRESSASANNSNSNSNSSSKAQLEAIRQFVAGSTSTTSSTMRELLGRPHNRRALLLVNALFFFMQLSGLHSFYFYMEMILSEAQVSLVRPSSLVYLVTLAGVVAGCAALRAIDRYGRKRLLALSSLGVALAMALFSCHYALLRLGRHEPRHLQALSIVASLAFQVFVCIGITPVPSTMLGELFPPNVKATAACITSTLAGLFAFVSSKTYQPLMDLMHQEYIFALYASVMLALLVFCLACLPETKGKTLQEIQQMLSSSSAETTANSANTTAKT